LNKVLIHGRCAKDPDVKTTASGQTVTRITIAVDRYTKAGEERKADFIPCTAWGTTAQFLAKYFTKGKEILCEGRIQTGSYTNQDGKKVYTTDVVLDRVEFCGSAGAKNAQTDDAEPVPF
jgi:single-strand DNA-binding protein